MAKAVVVGERHLILGFKGVGFEVVPVADGEQLAGALTRLGRTADVGLVLVTESLAAEAPQAVEEFRLKSQAILTIIPTHEGSTHVSFAEMRKAVERSMGVDLLGKEETS